MRYVMLGRSGLRVAELCLGAMTFGEEFGIGAGREESKRVFDAYLDAGGNFIDTANIYNMGTSERFVGEFAAAHRDRLVIATKFALSMNGQDANGGGNSRRNIVGSVEASLERLRTDRIDLYWVHFWDFVTPVDEIMRGLDDLVRSGKVLYIGVSNAPAWAIARANTLAELRGWSSFVAMQVHYNLVERTIERELVPMAAELGLGTLAWSPLAGGLLTGKYAGAATGGAEPARLHSTIWGPMTLTERNNAIAATVVQLAREIGITPAQLALAWLMHRPRLVIPILGARRLTQLQELLGCLAVKLDDAVLQRLEEATRIAMGYPTETLNMPQLRARRFGDIIDRIDFTRR